MEIHRDNIIIADLGENKGCVQSGIRPAVVIQNDLGRNMQIDKCIYCSKDLRCKILNVKKCTEKGCSFYKNKEMQKESISKSYERLNTIDKKTQNYISSKYYGGKKIWIRGRDENDC